MLAQRVEYGGPCVDLERFAFTIDPQGHVDGQGRVLDGRGARDGPGCLGNERGDGGAGRAGDECAAIESGCRGKIGIIGHDGLRRWMRGGARLHLLD